MDCGCADFDFDPDSDFDPDATNIPADVLD